MGFKDWGCWSLVGSFFNNQGFAFLKYNVSHNGGTVENPIDFPDPEAFSLNTYTNELTDFECVIETALSHFETTPALHVIGHSRGGGIAALQAHLPYVCKWISWAGIASIAERFPEGTALETWKNDGIRFVKNGRTLQNLPLRYEQYLDFKTNEARLNIEAHCIQNEKPCLLIHGLDDTSVAPEEAQRLSQWTKTTAVFIEGAQHTFNSAHPWEHDTMPEALEKICAITLEFITNG